MKSLFFSLSKFANRCFLVCQNFPNSSCHFRKHQSVFLQILYESSVSSSITPPYFFSSNIIYFVQKEPNKAQIFETFECLGQNLLKIILILKGQVNSSSNFASFFIAMTHNSSVSFNLIHLLFWMEGSHQSPNFETFECSGKNLSNSSCDFLSHKWVSLQFLHHSSVSWNITPSYFFSSSIIYFVQKKSIKVQIFEIFECSCQNLSNSSCQFWFLCEQPKVWKFALRLAPFVQSI